MWWLILNAVIAWLFADLITGAFHWFEDRYLDENRTLDFAHGIAVDNARHHTKPTAMLLCSWWENMRSAAYVAWPLAFGLWSIHCPLWLWLGVAFSAFGNLIHRFAHEPAGKLPRWIRGLQEFGVFISREHHDSHHRSDGSLINKECAAIAYCPMTDFVNPVIDRVKLWDRLEAVLEWLGFRPISREACPE